MRIGLRLLGSNIEKHDEKGFANDYFEVVLCVGLLKLR